VSTADIRYSLIGKFVAVSLALMTPTVAMTEWHVMPGPGLRGLPQSEGAQPAEVALASATDAGIPEVAQTARSPAAKMPLRETGAPGSLLLIRGVFGLMGL